MKIAIDRENCIGCGLCASLCPEVFDISAKDGRAEVHSESDEYEYEAENAADSCPVSVIYTDGNN